jgi:hypothetical protein
MKKQLLLFFLSLAPFCFFTQSLSYDNAVLSEASVNENDTVITIKWQSCLGASQYNLYRKLYGNTSWGAPIANLGPLDLFYEDSNIIANQLYEYRIMRVGSTGTAYGYLVSGINTQIPYNKGTMILIIDDYFLPDLQNEISELILDIEADGWFVQQQLVNRNNSVSQVKSLIQGIYNNDPVATNGLFLLGHVPVPYSGDINPDGHPDHLGAWPADVYYADMNGTWNDVSVNDALASDPRQHNVPGDGKFDESVLPSELELEVSRVDFYNLPAFSNTETMLMQNYLVKLHAFKTRQYIPRNIAVVEDNFLGMAEGFAGSAYAGFSPNVGIDSVINGDYTSELLNTNYLWAYGTGGGWYSGASGIVTTNDFATNNYQSTFSMLFGSYFGDWDSPDNLMRANLASGKTLSCSWSGRPYIYYHPLAMGEDLGSCIQKTQNNNATYFSSTLNTFKRWIHISQLGDPSLRSTYIAPPSNLVCSTNPNGTIQLTWTPSFETVIGYAIYRRDPTINFWTLINPAIISGTTYNDNAMINGGAFIYMVRAIDTLRTASGKYYNQSLGAFGNANSTVQTPIISINKYVGVYPNPTNDYATVLVPELLIGKEYKVLNFIGKEIESGTVESTTQKINLRQYPQGIYLLSLEGMESSLKIIKN